MSEVFAFHEAQKLAFIKNLLVELVEDGKPLNIFLKVCSFKRLILDHKLSSNDMNNYTNSKFHLQTFSHGSNSKINPLRTYKTF